MQIKTSFKKIEEKLNLESINLGNDGVEIDQKEKVFLFPLSRKGFEQVSSKRRLRQLLDEKFKQAYPNSKNKCIYNITVDVTEKHEKIMKACCKVCTNRIFYVKNFDEPSFRLIIMDEYHVHGADFSKLKEILKKKKLKRYGVSEKRVYEVPTYYTDDDFPISFEEYFKQIPETVTKPYRQRLMCERFKLTVDEYEKALKNIRKEYQISFKEFIQKLAAKNYQYRYLPKDLFQLQTERMINISNNMHVKPPRKKTGDFEDTSSYLDHLDEHNPDFPNVILIVTPQMKELFHKFGQYIGFDLTFSLIKEETEHSKQYLVGALAGTSEARKILIYGLVITNNQSTKAYEFIFRQFISIMKKSPQTIVTDEELTMAYALRNLKKQNVFKGVHLLDMFHILKKFRRAAEGPIFQLFRRMMHAKDRSLYRSLMSQLMNEVVNEDQLNLLRTYDYNSEKYCYSQIEKSFVGIGISDSMCQKFNDIVKAKIPFEAKYMKVINILLETIEKRNNLGLISEIQFRHLDQITSLHFLKSYKTILSDKILRIFMKEVFKSLSHQIYSEVFHQDKSLTSTKYEPELIRHELYQPSKYLIQTGLGIFLVWREFKREENGTVSNREGKWQCVCEYEEKSGFCCSHIIKVLNIKHEGFDEHIHPRWLIQQENINEAVLTYLQRDKRVSWNRNVSLRKIAVRKGINNVEVLFQRDQSVQKQEEEMLNEEISEKSQKDAISDEEMNEESKEDRNCFKNEISFQKIFSSILKQSINLQA